MAKELTAKLRLVADGTGFVGEVKVAERSVKHFRPVHPRLELGMCAFLWLDIQYSSMLASILGWPTRSTRHDERQCPLTSATSVPEHRPGVADGTMKRTDLSFAQENLPLLGRADANGQATPLSVVSDPHSPTVADARQALHQRFADRLAVRGDLSRRIVSYQANKGVPGLRWVKYKEGFSTELVQDALRVADGPVLDPFAGIGTTPLVAAGAGRRAIGFEIMPLGALAAQAISCVARQADPWRIERAGKRLLRALRSRSEPPPEHRFPHVPITRHAFSPETEDAIGRARASLARMRDDELHLVLNVACMSVLEEASFTRKDGQYLRWDNRCGRDLRGGMNKGPIPGYIEALERRLSEIIRDQPALSRHYGASAPRIVEGSAFVELPKLADDSVGLTVTSPPYANRYDYTRTYALELAWLGYDREAFGALRQALVSATVENRSKEEQLERDYPRRATLNRARAAVRSQAALADVVQALQARRSELSNPHVIRLVANYFSEMALVVAELARVTRPGGAVVMVNDNVQYHGEEVPVDLILAAIAEDCGFVCEEIGVLPRGKGNASQQMGRFGRRELRKCVYRWRLP